MITIKQFLEHTEAYHNQWPMGHPWLEEIRNLRTHLAIAYGVIREMSRDPGSDPEVRQMVDEAKLLLIGYEMMAWREGLRTPECATLLLESPKVVCPLPGLYEAGELHYCLVHKPDGAQPIDLFNL